MKILQANLGRSRAALDLAHENAARDDIMTISEPNKSMAKNGWIRDHNANVAVKLLNKSIRWIKLNNVSIML